MHNHIIMDKPAEAVDEICFDETFVIPASHPSLAGHFPNHPVVPAVVLLNEMTRLMMLRYPEYALKELGQAKFMQLILPEQKVLLSLRGTAMDACNLKVKFVLSNEAGETCAKGSGLFSKLLER